MVKDPGWQVKFAAFFPRIRAAAQNEELGDEVSDKARDCRNPALQFRHRQFADYWIADILLASPVRRKDRAPIDALEFETAVASRRAPRKIKGRKTLRCVRSISAQRFGGRPSQKSKRTDLQMPEVHLQRPSKFRSGGSGAAPAARSFGEFGGGSRMEAIVQRDLGGEGRLRAKKACPPCSALRSPAGERLAA